MLAVGLQGRANAAPEQIGGPFASVAEAEEWWRDAWYFVAQELT